MTKNEFEATQKGATQFCERCRRASTGSVNSHCFCSDPECIKAVIRRVFEIIENSDAKKEVAHA